MRKIVDVVTLSDSDEEEPPVDDEQSHSEQVAGSSKETKPCHVAIELPDWFSSFDYYYHTRLSELDPQTDVDDFFKAIAKEWSEMSVMNRQKITDRMTTMSASADATATTKQNLPHHSKSPSLNPESTYDTTCSRPSRRTDQHAEVSASARKSERSEGQNPDQRHSGSESHSAVPVEKTACSRQESEKENLAVLSADSKEKESVPVASKSSAKKKAGSGEAIPGHTHKEAKAETAPVKKDKKEKEANKEATTSSKKTNKKDPITNTTKRSEAKKTKGTGDGSKRSHRGHEVKSEATIAFERELEKLMNKNADVVQRYDKCLGPGCEKAPIDDPDWDCEYCSPLCCQNHVSLEFQKFVKTEKKKNKAAAAGASASKNT